MPHFWVQVYTLAKKHVTKNITLLAVGCVAQCENVGL